MVDGKDRRPIRQSPPPREANQAGRLEFTPYELTRWQKARRWWNDRVPHSVDINTLFIATGRHEVRLNWRSPFAIPFVLLLVVLSPLLLPLAGIFWVMDKVAAWKRAATHNGSDGR